jgi:hypothetical protein
MSATRCRQERANISARLDGELDGTEERALEHHLETCESCRAEDALVRGIRRSLRVHAVEEVPDLTDSIMASVTAEGPRLRTRSEWAIRFKVASVAAAVAALVLIGATLPTDEGPGDVASASEITAGVLSAARSLETYRASYDIVERGWNPNVGLRRFSAEVWFRSPERLRLLISDFTAYPSHEWPRNNIELIASPQKWWIEEPSQCPQAALPACAIKWGPPTENRTIVHRQPFDGTSDLPTDLIVPLETLVSSADFDVIGEPAVAGQASYHIALPYRDATPLVGALQPGGSWRPFNPLDRVELWIDQSTWIPLEFRVIASSSPDRALWAEQQGLADRAGETLLSVKAATFATHDAIAPETFHVPTRGLVKSGGFNEMRGGDVATGPEPRYVAGLDPYRAGRTTSDQVVRSYARGTTWLKVTSERSRPARSWPATAEQIRLPAGAGWAYYEPATVSSNRRVDVFTPRWHAHLESNLRSDEMYKVAASLGIVGRRGPAHVDLEGGASITRIEDDDPYGSVSYALKPSSLPGGYGLRTSLLTRSREGRSTLTTYYRSDESEFDGFGVRITQSRPVRLLLPSSRDFSRVRVNGADGRWSAESGELEWLDGTTYRSVAVPSFDLSTALSIARSMR